MPLDISISSTYAFKTFIQNLTLQPQTTFEVIQEESTKKSGKFTGIRVNNVNDVIDVSCRAQFQCCINDCPLESPCKFAINVRTCVEFLKKVENNVLLHITSSDPNQWVEVWYSYGGVEKLRMKATPKVAKSPVPSFSIKTKYTIRANVGVLKKFNKLSKVVESNGFQFTVKKIGTVKDPGPVPIDQIPSMLTVFSFQSAAETVQRIFPGTSIPIGTRECNLPRDTCVHNLLARLDLSKLETLFETSIAHKHLTSFIRHMDKENNIEIGLSPDYPVVLNYRMGIPNSYIRHVVAHLVTNP